MGASRYFKVMTLGLGVVAGGGLAATDAMAQQRNCIDTLAGMPEYSRMVTAVTMAHMVTDLRLTQNITIFAPNNAAIEAVNPMLRDRIFPRDESGAREADPVLAAAAINTHVVQGRLPAAALAPTMRVTSAAGTPLTFNRDGNVTTVTAAEGVSARVVQGDIACSNGVIHSIDRVLLR
jgi:uncharacterized surface protein with fasciclin (FAS1) repeats